MLVRYRDEEKGLRVNLIYEWTRNDLRELIEHPTSKATFAQDIADKMDKDRQIERALMVRGEYAASLPFVLWERDGKLSDALHREVICEP